MPDQISLNDTLLGTKGTADNGRQGYILNVAIAGGGGGDTSTTVQGAGAAGSAASGNPVLVAGSDGTNTRTVRTDTVGNQIVSSGPSAAPYAAIVPVVGVGVTALAARTSPGNLYSASIVSGATAGFLISYNAAAVPAAGAALTANLVLGVAPVAANSYANLGGDSIPERFTAGIVLLFSTSTTTYTAPANPALHMKGKSV